MIQQKQRNVFANENHGWEGKKLTQDKMLQGQCGITTSKMVLCGEMHKIWKEFRRFIHKIAWWIEWGFV